MVGIILVAGLLLLSGAESMKIKKCLYSEVAVPEYAAVGDCKSNEPDTPCHLKQGSEALCKLDFTSAVATKQVKLVVTLNGGGISREIHDDPKMCDFIQSCPIKKGGKAVFKLDDIIEANVTNGTRTTNVEMKLLNAKTGDYLTCFCFEATYS